MTFDTREQSAASTRDDAAAKVAQLKKEIVQLKQAVIAHADVGQAIGGVGRPLTPADRRGPTPLFWSPVRPYGGVDLGMDACPYLAVATVPGPHTPAARSGGAGVTHPGRLLPDELAVTPSMSVALCQASC
ncbi:hypothetical protein ACIREE_27260 [Streptomyces sp. NPDC102467]|uniref:hypothetical protein n=1 Tax=Streptomyces sp. NPDC102467 TaxID=3366179 RepID=UPI00382FC181